MVPQAQNTLWAVRCGRSTLILWVTNTGARNVPPAQRALYNRTPFLGTFYLEVEANICVHSRAVLKEEFSSFHSHTLIGSVCFQLAYRIPATSTLHSTNRTSLFRVFCTKPLCVPTPLYTLERRLLPCCRTDGTCFVGAKTEEHFTF